MKVSALIVNYNSGEFAVNCMRSLQEEAGAAGLTLQTIVVDNDSPTDQAVYRRAIRQEGGEWVDHGWNAGYSAGLNRAFRESEGDLILVTNPDIKFLPGSLGRLAAALDGHPDRAAVGPNTWWDIRRQVQFPPNLVPTLGDALSQSLAHRWPRWNRRYALNRTREAIKVWRARGEVELKLLSGGCMLVPRTVWLRLGGFDERYPLYYEDTDWFMRARALGLKLVQVQDAHIAHFFNRSGITDSDGAFSRYWTSRRRYYRKFYGILGEWVAGVTRWVAHGSGRQRPPMDRIRELGDVDAPFTIPLERECASYLLELTQDPGFFMAGAIFGSGSTWTPGQECWNVFGPTRYYLRVFDLSGGDPAHLGTWTFRKVAP